MTQDNTPPYINTGEYPIHEPGSNAYSFLLNRIHKQISATGCAVLPGFIKRESIHKFVEEANAVAESGFHSTNRTNVYFTKDDESLEPDHPARQFYNRSNSFVPADNFGPDSTLRSVYQWPFFMPFIKDALNEKDFYRYADPLADVIINVVEDGSGFPWHFDTNNYTVTLAIQNGESGGMFEYAPNLRSAGNENYEGVKAILDGHLDQVHTLELNPGDLQIFKGRYSLHRVTPVRGDVPRYVGIFSFVDRPGMVAKPERAKQLYGRALPIHYEQGLARTDTLID